MADNHPSQLVVFDFDGTLADTWRDLATALNRTLGEAGLPPVEGPEVRFWIGDGALKLLERAVPAGALSSEGDLEHLFEVFRVHYDECCLETTELYPGIPQCLDALQRSRRVELAVVSNKPVRFLDRVMAGLGLKASFGVVLGGDTLPIRKPDPAVIEHVVAQIARAPEQVWVIGDSATDVNTGRASGARTIGCTWGLRGRDELREAGAEFLIDSPDAIPSLVLSG